MSVLKPRSKSATRTLSVRLPSTTLDELDAVRSQAEAAGFVLDVPEIVGRALQNAVRSAQAELSARTPPAPAKVVAAK